MASARVVFGKFYVLGSGLPVLDAEGAASEAVNPTVGGTTTITAPNNVKSGAMVSSDSACIAKFGDDGAEFLVPEDGHILVAVPPGVACTISPVS
jgi:hypothetical protein